MKLNTEKILPIILSIILPVLNAITTRNVTNIDQITQRMLFQWGAIALVLYFLWYVLEFVHNKSHKHKWVKVLLAVFVFLIVIYNLFLLFPVFQKHTFKWLFILKYFLAVIPFLVIQDAFRARKKVAQLELEKQQMQTENYRAQLESLRAKVDPHFLFNSLNTLRTMVRHQHPQSEQFVLSLSDFYRQILKYNEATTIRLSEEMAVLESYLFLMKNRNEAAVQVNIAVDPQLLEYQIPTLALQTVVENCFKHNVMSSKMPLYIDIRSNEDFCIEVQNNIQPKFDPKESSGYGLHNLNTRYELWGIHNGVCITQTDESFSVKLKLI